MKCNGCKHCKWMTEPDAGIKARHYCDKFLFADTIGDAFKWCKARFYEIRDNNKVQVEWWRKI